MISFLKTFNLALRGIMEFGLVAGLAYWGFYTGTSTLTKIVLGAGAPIVIFGFWGMVDFRNAGKNAEFFRLFQEIILSFLTALALYFTGQLLLGWLMAAISIVHHILVYALGEKLLKV